MGASEQVVEKEVSEQVVQEEASEQIVEVKQIQMDYRLQIGQKQLSHRK